MQEKVLKRSAYYYWTNEAAAEKAILFLHPAFADHSCFDEQAAYFQNHKLIIPDLIGHGKSLGKGKISETTDRILEILEAEKVEKINLAGVSIGGVLAQDFANRHPERVASLCCIGAYDINNFDEALGMQNSKQQMKLMLLGFLSIRLFANENKKISAFTPEAQERFYQMNLRFKKSSLRYLSTLGKLINQGQTAARSYPLMIGIGEHDNELAKQASTAWAASEPAAKFVVFPGAGHIVNMDTPLRINQELELFLR